MKKVLLLTRNPFSAEKRICFDEQINGIMVAQKVTGALVCSKESPNDIPYKYHRFGDSTKCSIEKCLIDLHDTNGKSVNYPMINDLVIVESLSINNLTEDIRNYSKEDLAEFIVANIKANEDIHEIDAIYVEAPLKICYGLLAILKNLNLYFINIAKNYQITEDGNRLEIYALCDKDKSLGVVYSSKTIFFDTLKAVHVHN